MRKGQTHSPEARAKISAARRESVAKAKGSGGSAMREIGVSGLDVSGGRPQDEFLRQLAGGKATKVFREMADNDPVIGALLFSVEMLTRRAEWRWEGDSDELIEFFDGALNDMSTSWPDTLSSILTMLPFGWDYEELVYKRRNGSVGDVVSKFDDGRIGWRKWATRSQDSLIRWEFDDAGGVQGMLQAPPGFGSPVLIPIEKALLFRTTARKGNPEGRSVLRNAYRPWFYKKRIEEIEAIGIERDLAGLPVGKVPINYLKAGTPEALQAEEFKKVLRNIRRDEQEAILWPLAYDEEGHELFKLELLTTGGRRQFDTDAVVGRYDQRIAMTILADFILLGHENVGAKSLGSIKVDLFTTALEAWLQSIADVVNTHAVPRLGRLNGFREEDLPRLVPGNIDRVDLNELGEFVGKVAGAGAPLFPNPELENALLRAAKLPEIRDEHADQEEAALPVPMLNENIEE